MFRSSGRFFSGISHIFNNQLFQLSSSWNSVKISTRQQPGLFLELVREPSRGRLVEGLESLPAPETGT